MKNYDVIVDGVFIGRVSSKDIWKLERLMPYSGISFIETVKGLDSDVQIKISPDLGLDGSGFCISGPPCK